jgi:hypothetical protein
MLIQAKGGEVYVEAQTLKARILRMYSGITPERVGAKLWEFSVLPQSLPAS